MSESRAPEHPPMQHRSHRWEVAGVTVAIIGVMASFGATIYQIRSSDHQDRQKTAFEICRTFLTAPTIVESHNIYRRYQTRLENEKEDLSELKQMAHGDDNEWSRLSLALRTAANYL